MIKKSVNSVFMLTNNPLLSTENISSRYVATTNDNMTMIIKEL
ncbi:MAG: hypothetical protein WCZ17_00060 [Candidatus Kapaibacterium sp.]